MGDEKIPLHEEALRKVMGDADVIAQVNRIRVFTVGISAASLVALIFLLVYAGLILHKIDSKTSGANKIINNQLQPNDEAILAKLRELESKVRDGQIVVTVSQSPEMGPMGPMFYPSPYPSPYPYPTPVPSASSLPTQVPTPTPTPSLTPTPTPCLPIICPHEEETVLEQVGSSSFRQLLEAIYR